MTTASISAITAVALVSCLVPTALSREQEAARSARPAESIIASVDGLFAEWNRSDSPGCSLGVSRNGAVVYERGYGMANLEVGVAITPASVFHVASISKQFTAMSILLLAGRGQLSLDDEVRKHVPEWAGSGQRLTLRHLLTHTAGLRDPFLLVELAAPRGDLFDTDAIVRLLARQRGLNFAPGAEFQYSNGGYALLATIVQRVSGLSLRAFADANIFKPLGMTHTHIHDDPAMIVPNRASGYRRRENAWQNAIHANLGRIVGTTALFTTARDLLAWQRNFADVRVGDPALLAAMQTPAVLRGGETSAYGFGLAIGRDRGRRTIGHGGGDPGVAAHVVRYPDEGLAVAVLCNLDGLDPARLTQGVAGLFLADAGAAPPAGETSATPPRVSLSAGQLADKAGLYRDPSDETLLRVFVRDGRLMGSLGAGVDGGWEMAPLDANRFVIPGTPTALEFVPAAAGGVRELHVTGGQAPRVLQRLPAFAPSDAELRSVAGDYVSAELDVTYTVALRDSGLVIRIPGRTDITMQPIFADAYAGSLVGVVRFSRDARGVVTGFTLHTDGVRRLPFDRATR